MADNRRPMLRAVLATTLVMAGMGCGGSGGGPAQGARLTGTYDPYYRQVDVLFVVDDSPSMQVLQDKLVRDFPAFVTGLMSGPGGLPDLHLAVISPDMGAGDGSITGCDATGGKQGIFQHAPGGSCTTTNLNAGATYISAAGGVRNFAGNLEDVFGCIAALGETGCSFEQPFAAILRALGADGLAAPSDNQGFLRQGAALAIIMLTNEDDCSAEPGVALFETSQNKDLASELGPPTNFRCNEFGHICDGGRPRRTTPADVTSEVTYNLCESNDTEAYMLSVADTAARLKALKTDPSKVAFVSIQGPPTPYTVQWATSPLDSSCGAPSCPWPEIGHSCTAPDSTYGDPGVRTAQLASAFDSNGLVLAVCNDSFQPNLQRAAELVTGLVGPKCITAPIALDPKAPGQPACTITARFQSTGGQVSESKLMSCDETGGAPPCWTLTQQAGCEGWVFGAVPDPTLPAAGEYTVSYDCARCTAIDPAPGDCY